MERRTGLLLAFPARLRVNNVLKRELRRAGSSLECGSDGWLAERAGFTVILDRGHSFALPAERLIAGLLAD